MKSSKICCQASAVYLDFAFPERVVARALEGKAKQYPKIAIGLEVIASVFLGATKILVLPLASFSGVFLFPLRGIMQIFTTGKISSVAPYLLASLIALLVSALLIATLFCSILVAPEIVFILIGVLGAVCMSTTLLQMHEGLFAPSPENVLLIQDKEEPTK